MYVCVCVCECVCVCGCVSVCVCLRKYFEFLYIWLNNLPFLSAEDQILLLILLFL